MPENPSAFEQGKSHLPLNRTSVEAAHALIQQHIHLTPVLTNTTLSNLASTPQTAGALKGTQWEGKEPARPKIKLFFKCENFQRIGAFKVRGAFHAVIRLIEERGLDEVRKKGVITHSSGMFACPFTPLLITRLQELNAHNRKPRAGSFSCRKDLLHTSSHSHA